MAVACTAKKTYKLARVGVSHWLSHLHLDSRCCLVCTWSAPLQPSALVMLTGNLGHLMEVFQGCQVFMSTAGVSQMSGAGRPGCSSASSAEVQAMQFMSS